MRKVHRVGLHLGFTRIWHCGAVYTQNLIQQGTAIDPGRIHGGGEGGNRPPDGCWVKIETPAWVIKPAFNDMCFWSAKSRFYHPVSYSVPCHLLIACPDSPKLTSQCMPLSGLSQFPFNSTAKTASRMHQNSPFYMGPHWNISIDVNTDIADDSGWHNFFVANSKWQMWQLMQTSTGSRPQNLGLCSIQLEPIWSHPAGDVVDTAGDVVL